jgi:8-amino-3,8-dideoxy-alpha-D-manno-octulosonate transaminase
MTKAAVAEMKADGIMAGNFYWFDNNWHYIRKWDHLKFSATLNNINPLQKEALDKLADTSFPESDAIMSRCISTAISLMWTEAQLHEKGEKMVAAITRAIASVALPV